MSNISTTSVVLPTRRSRIERRWGGARSCLMVGLILGGSMGWTGWACPPVSGQEFSFRDVAKKLSPSSLFKKKAIPSADEPPAASSQRGARPTPLKVIDRATANRNALADATPPVSGHDLREGRTDPGQVSDRDFDRNPQRVEPASYQQPAPRVYTSPAAPVSRAPAYSPRDRYAPDSRDRYAPRAYEEVAPQGYRNAGSYGHPGRDGVGRLYPPRFDRRDDRPGDDGGREPMNGRAPANGVPYEDDSQGYSTYEPAANPAANPAAYSPRRGESPIEFLDSPRTGPRRSSRPREPRRRERPRDLPVNPMRSMDSMQPLGHGESIGYGSVVDRRADPRGSRYRQEEYPSDLGYEPSDSRLPVEESEYYAPQTSPVHDGLVYEPEYDSTYDSEYELGYEPSYEPSYDSGYEPGYDSRYESGYESGVGRGYLQNGPNYQGRRLSSNPQTATERALEIQADNDRLKESVTRTQLELDNRVEELADVRAMYQRKEQELAESMTHVNELNARLVRLKSELKVAIRENTNVKRRADEQLRAIESTLDGVLLNSISQNSNSK